MRGTSYSRVFPKSRRAPLLSRVRVKSVGLIRCPAQAVGARRLWADGPTQTRTVQNPNWRVDWIFKVSFPRNLIQDLVLSAYPLIREGPGRAHYGLSFRPF